MGFKTIHTRVSPALVVSQLRIDLEYLFNVKSTLHYLLDALRVELIFGALLEKHREIIILQHFIIFPIEVAKHSKNCFSINL
jgi:hypothetical protein